MMRTGAVVSFVPCVPEGEKPDPAVVEHAKSLGESTIPVCPQNYGTFPAYNTEIICVPKEHETSTEGEQGKCADGQVEDTVITGSTDIPAYAVCETVKIGNVISSPCDEKDKFTPNKFYDINTGTVTSTQR